ncbi:MAG: phosphopantothenoylcysteine decarboxylase, partial [Atribacterota bacterium]
VETALEMEEAMQKEFEPCDGCIMNAAVSDFRPTSSFATKLKKNNTRILTYPWFPTPISFLD